MLGYIHIRDLQEFTWKSVVQLTGNVTFFRTETKRRCGFFLNVFGLSLPEYLDCSLFPESLDSNICVGSQEVIDAEIRARQAGESIRTKFDGSSR